MERAADVCRVSRRHLDDLFKKELGHSMHAELTKIRLRTAKAAVSTTTDSIEKISRDCGFTRVQYLNKSFKTFFGVNPLKYRKLAQEA